jgi:hypothetical protein
MIKPFKTHAMRQVALHSSTRRRLAVAVEKLKNDAD